MIHNYHLFFTALMYYTRIPCPKNIPYTDNALNQATRYFPLIGWIVGTIAFLVFWGLEILFPKEIAVLGSLLAGILVTGAFHEDGFADMVDGFGGGWSREKILDIMKDSRLGTYGAIALVVLMGLKFFSLLYLVKSWEGYHVFFLLLSFVTVHSVARFAAVHVAFLSRYVREDEKSKAKPIAKAHGKTEIFHVYIWGLLPLISLAYFHPEFLFIMIPIYILIFYCKYYYEKWIGGYTGDCLGATEQMAELVILLGMIVLWK